MKNISFMLIVTLKNTGGRNQVIDIKKMAGENLRITA